MALLEAKVSEADQLFALLQQSVVVQHGEESEGRTFKKQQKNSLE